MKKKWELTNTFELSTMPLTASVCCCFELTEAEAAVLSLVESLHAERERLEREADSLIASNKDLFDVINDGSNMILSPTGDTIRSVRNIRASRAYQDALRRGMVDEDGRVI